MMSTPVAAIAATVSRFTPPARLDERAAGDERDALAQLVRREVVEHDRVDAGRDDRLDLVDPVDLDLEVGGVPDAGAGGADRVADRRRRPPASTARWLSFASTASESEKRWLCPPPSRTACRSSDAQAGRRLAGVDDARRGAGDRLDVAGGEGGDARHPLHEVEGDALGPQHGARRAVDAREHVARREAARRLRRAARRAIVGSTSSKTRDEHRRRR